MLPRSAPRFFSGALALALACTLVVGCSSDQVLENPVTRNVPDDVADVADEPAHREPDRPTTDANGWSTYDFPEYFTEPGRMSRLLEPPPQSSHVLTQEHYLEVQGSFERLIVLAYPEASWYQDAEAPWTAHEAYVPDDYVPGEVPKLVYWTSPTRSATIPGLTATQESAREVLDLIRSDLDFNYDAGETRITDEAQGRLIADVYDDTNTGGMFPIRMEDNTLSVTLVMLPSEWWEAAE